MFKVNNKDNRIPQLVLVFLSLTLRREILTGDGIIKMKLKKRDKAVFHLYVSRKDG